MREMEMEDEGEPKGELPVLTAMYDLTKWIGCGLTRHRLHTGSGAACRPIRFTPSLVRRAAPYRAGVEWWCVAVVAPAGCRPPNIGARSAPPRRRRAIGAARSGGRHPISSTPPIQNPTPRRFQV